MKTFSLLEMRKDLSRVFDLAQEEEIVIIRYGQPFVRLTGMKGKKIEDLIEEEVERKDHERNVEVG